MFIWKNQKANFLNLQNTTGLISDSTRPSHAVLLSPQASLLNHNNNFLFPNPLPPQFSTKTSATARRLTHPLSARLWTRNRRNPPRRQPRPRTSSTSRIWRWRASLRASFESTSLPKPTPPLPPLRRNPIAVRPRSRRNSQETWESCRASPPPKAASATFTWSAPLMSPRYFVLVVWNQVLGFLALHIVTVFSHNENLGFLFSFLWQFC